jgi:primosomal replication protein N
MNQVLLQARVVERAAMRYTPAGLPVVDLKLAHESERWQQGQNRKVALELPASAIGDLAHVLVATAIGTAGRFEGFLVKQRNGRGVTLQIEQFMALPDDVVAGPGPQL